MDATNIKITLWAEGPQWTQLGIHKKTEHEDVLTNWKRVSSEGEIAYNLKNRIATVLLRGRFPILRFEINDFHTFLYRDIDFSDLQKLLLVYIEKSQKEIHALREAARKAEEEMMT